MKPDWDKLMDEFKGSKHAGIFDVDCTAGGKDLCEKVGVSGYPTIKHGDPSKMDKLEDYSGGRDFESLKKFAEETLGPVCGPTAMDACDDAEKAIVEAAMAKPAKDLDAEIAKLDKDFSAKQKAFQKRKSKFDEKYNEFQEELQEHRAAKISHEKSKAKLEANAKASKVDKDKFAKQDKKMQEAIVKFDKKAAAKEAEKAVFEKDAADMVLTMKVSGLKLMKLVKATKPKDEL